MNSNFYMSFSSLEVRTFTTFLYIKLTKKISIVYDIFNRVIYLFIYLEFKKYIYNYYNHIRHRLFDFFSYVKELMNVFVFLGS